MRESLSIVTAVILALAISLSAQIWGGDQRLTNDPANSQTCRNNAWCVAASGNTIHVVWYDWRHYPCDIYYKRSTNAGVTWGTDTPITQDDLFCRNPAVAVYGENIHVVWHDESPTDIGGIYYQRSTNNGESWSPPYKFTDKGLHPSIATSGNKVYVVWEDYRHGTSKIYYNRSINYGVSWEMEENLINDDEAICYYPSIAVSGNNVHVVWEDNRDGNWEIYYSLSTNGGISWGMDTRLTDDESGSYCPSIAVYENNVHMVWENKHTWKGDIHYMRSTDGGASWETDIKLIDTIGGDPMSPSIAVWANEVYVVWDDHRDNNWEVYYKRAIDDGVNWGMDQRLTNDTADSYYPSVETSENEVHVVWYDERGDYGTEIYYKRGSKLQPDNLIKTASESGYTGNDIYNNDGTEQTKEQNVEARTTAVYHIKIENDAAIIDTIEVRGTGDTTDWTVIYYDALTAGNDITSQITGSGWSTKSLAPGFSKEMRVEITSFSPTPSNYDVLVTSTSKRDTLKKDAIKITTASTGIEESPAEIPREFFLEASSMLISKPVLKYGIPHEREISLVVYDATGRNVKTLVSGRTYAGYHTVTWDGCDSQGMHLPQGVYFCTLKADGFKTTRKMVLLR